MHFATRLAYLSKRPLIGRFAEIGLRLLGVELPREVTIGPGFELAHGAIGTVIHGSTRIGPNVKIYQGVTFGRADIHLPASQSAFRGFVVEEGAIICANSTVIGKRGVLTIGKNAIIGANALVMSDVGENEIWAGNPARKIGVRKAEGLRENPAHV